MNKTTILLLGSSPSDEGPLSLTKEFDEIDDALSRSKLRDAFDLRQKWEIQARKLAEVLLRFLPRVVHFSGHGNASGELLFQAEDGSSQPAGQELIGSLFRAVGGIRCAVLNACYSARQAQAIAEHVDVVIGMSRAVKDTDAIVFATSFYGAVGNGASVASAFDVARCAIPLAGLSDADVPRMITRSGVDPGRIQLHLAAEGILARVDRAEVERALSDFFLELFSGTELRQRVGALQNGHALRAWLPEHIPDADLAQRAARLLMERSALSETWFHALAEEIPRRKRDIALMAQKWARWVE